MSEWLCSESQYLCWPSWCSLCLPGYIWGREEQKISEEDILAGVRERATLGGVWLLGDTPASRRPLGGSSILAAPSTAARSGVRPNPAELGGLGSGIHCVLNALWERTRASPLGQVLLGCFNFLLASFNSYF